MSSFNEQLDHLATLTAGWDGERAGPISRGAIEKCRSWCNEYPQAAEHALFVPRCDGSLQLEWCAGGAELEIEFHESDYMAYLQWLDNGRVQVEQHEKYDSQKCKTLFDWWESEVCNRLVEYMPAMSGCYTNEGSETQ